MTAVGTLGMYAGSIQASHTNPSFNTVQIVYRVSLARERFAPLKEPYSVVVQGRKQVGLSPTTGRSNLDYQLSLWLALLDHSAKCTRFRLRPSRSYKCSRISLSSSFVFGHVAPSTV